LLFDTHFYLQIVEFDIPTPLKCKKDLYFVFSAKVLFFGAELSHIGPKNQTLGKEKSFSVKTNYGPDRIIRLRAWKSNHHFKEECHGTQNQYKR